MTDCVRNFSFRLVWPCLVGYSAAGIFYTGILYKDVPRPRPNPVHFSKNLCSRDENHVVIGFFKRFLASGLIPMIRLLECGVLRMIPTKNHDKYLHISVIPHQKK